MGIYIKGMEMPHDCGHCRFAVDGWCYAYGKPNIDALANDGRTNFCPLVPVPPHGRLGDLDACAEYFESQAQDEWNKNTGTTWSNAYLSLGAYIEEDAPTVIPEDPAEEGE